MALHRVRNESRCITDAMTWTLIYLFLFYADEEEEPSSPELHVLEGQGSFKLEGWWLRLRQFHGLTVKRFHCAKRNTKVLFSQILLPAFFVCVAMTVALSVPEIGKTEQGGGV